MDPKHLLDDELAYELQLRNINPHSSDYMAALQACLDAESSDQQRKPDDKARITRHSVKKELNECSMQLQHIVKAVEAAVSSADTDALTKVRSRLAHIAGRIGRLREFAPEHAAANRLAERVREITQQMAEEPEDGAWNVLPGVLPAANKGAVPKLSLYPESTQTQLEDLAPSKRPAVAGKIQTLSCTRSGERQPRS